MKDIVYLVENKIFEKDFERYGIDYFNKNKKYILDFSAYIHNVKHTFDFNKENVFFYSLKSYEDLKKFKFRNALIIDCLSYTKKSFQIRKIIKKKIL